LLSLTLGILSSFSLSPPYSKVRDDYRMDVDEDRGGIGGGALRVMQRQGFDLRDLIGTPQERGEEPVREVSMTQ